MLNPTESRCVVTVAGDTRPAVTYTNYRYALYSLDKFSDWAEFTTMPCSEILLDIERKLGAVRS